MKSVRINESLNSMVLACDARGYYEAYLELSKNKEKQFQLASPRFMCLAFSLELHVKLLLRLHGKKPWGHEISKLVKELPATDIEILSMSDHLYPMHRGENFNEELFKLNRFFNRVRYYFEDLGTMKLDPWFSLGLINAIRERVATLSPSLAYDLGVQQ